MFAETFLRLNYVVSYQLYLLAERVKKKYSTRLTGVRKSLIFTRSNSFEKCNSISSEKEVENILSNSDSLYENGLYEESLQILNQTLNVENPQVLWRHARVLHSYAMATSEKSVKRQMISAALSKLKDALRRQEQSHMIHVWLSVFLLRHAETYGLSASIFQYMNEAHTHMLRAIELAPNDPLVWFSLAHYEYNLADLPWLQRKIVLTAFSVQPTATYEKALEYFKKAENLKPGFSALNQLMIAKCLIALGNAAEAESYLKTLAHVRKIRNEDDKTSQKTAEHLLHLLNKNRQVLDNK